MRTLTPTLLAAQKKAVRTPAVAIQARNISAGVVNLKWERLYTGSEPDGSYALTLPGDGSLIRIRATPAGDSRKLYRQRVISPGPGSDFSQWTYLNQYNVMAAAACSLGAEVSLFWAKSNSEIHRQKSLDNGATWQATDYPGYAPTGNVTQMAAAYKPNGDLALFFTDTSTLYLIKRVSGTWQSRVAWDKTTGDLLGVASVYDGDWKLLVSGRDSSGNFKIWSLIYGDGGEITAGNWSPLKEIATAPSDGGYEFDNLFLDKPDEYRCFFTEKYTGTEAYSRPFWSHTLPGTDFLDNRWREPVPFDLDCQNSLAMAHTGNYAWLSMPAGIWRADLTSQSLDLSSDLIAVSCKQLADSGEIIIELQNYSGKYSTPGTGDMAVLETGCRIDFSPGYRTAAGNEYSSGLSFILQAYEHTSFGGKATLILYAGDGWATLASWNARYQFRWNKPDQYGNPTQEASVKEILSQVLARCGQKLEVISQSSVITGFYPDFTIHVGDNGRSVVNRLLSFVPDVIFTEGDNAYLVNPSAADTAVYNYGTDHVILDGRYRTGARKINRVKVEGPGIMAESFAWEEIERHGDILQTVEDLNLTTTARALERGSAYLREAEIESVTGLIRVPVNCGQQLYDVVAITDSKAGLNAAKRRLVGMNLSYLPSKGEYEQKLILGAP